MSESAPAADDAALHVGPAPDAPATPTEASPTPVADAVPAAPPAAPPAAADAPAPDVDPLTVAQGDIARLTAENAKLQEDLARVTAEHTQLHLALDAERAKPSQEALAQQVVNLKAQLEKLQVAHDLLKEQPAPAASFSFALSETDIARITTAMLEALAAHAVPQVVEEPPAPPASPFINRQG